jgi:outer membrane biosynthesis protein TonB
LKIQEENEEIKIEEVIIPSSNPIPAVLRKTPNEIPLGESIFTSFALHLSIALVLYTVVFVCKLFNIDLAMVHKPKPPMQDIQFVMNKKSQPKIHSKVQEKAKQGSAASAPAPKTAAPKTQKTTPKTQKTTPKTQKTTPKATAKKAPKISQSKGPSKITKNIFNNKAKGKSSAKHSSKSGASDFSMPMPSLNKMSSGLGSSGRTRIHSSGIGSSGSSNSNIDNAFSSGDGSSNHSGFDKSATKKIITTYDISPYVSELKRNIRWNWSAPKGYENKRVELFLRIAKDGRIVILNVKRTSEVGAFDNAALNAVRKCVPLNPLPSKYSKSYLDVVFSFSSGSISSRY